MKFYKVVSSHWHGTMEFKSELNFEMGQCFRITAHDGYKSYPTFWRNYKATFGKLPSEERSEQ